MRVASRALLVLILLSANALATPEQSVDGLFSGFGADAPGCAIAVMHDGAIVYERGYGLADLDHRIPITPRTVFDIGSTSKQFTATAVLLLVEEGKLSLEDGVRKWIPELPAYAAAVTLRQLLQHRSGVRDYCALGELAGVRREDLFTATDALTLIARQRALDFPPGTESYYSNSGYLLLSLVVERAAGQPFAEFLKRRIFLPLGMRDTHVHADHTEVVLNRAIGYESQPGGTFRQCLSNWEPAGDGSVYTTVEDLARWDKNFFMPRVGSARLLAQLLEQTPLPSGEEIPYGLGLAMSMHRGQRVVDHDGGWVGYRADLLRLPEQHFSVACLCNRADADPSALSLRIVDAYLDAKLPKEAEPSTSSAPSARAADLASVEGTYYSERRCEVRRYKADKGRLLFALNGHEWRSMARVGPFTFRIAPGVALHRFAPGRDGRASVVYREIGRESQPSARFAPASAAAADDYAGVYHSQDLETDYSVQAHDGRLQLAPRRMSRIDLETVGRDLFIAGTASVRFTRGAHGQVAGFVLTDDGARCLSFDRLPRSSGRAP